MLSIPKYPEQYAQHFPAIFYLLCCASQHHVLHQTLARTRLPGLILWDAAQRLIRLSNDVHPNPGPSPPPRPDLSFLTLNVGGPFLSRRRSGHLLAEIIAE